jgi:uncharacterized repeat protein (TIGR03803 family)
MKSRRNSRIYLTAAIAAITFSLAVRAQAQTESTLYSFTGATTGNNPIAGLIADAAGNLYGVAEGGGNISDCGGAGCGVAFELSPDGTGGWTQTVLHTFTGGNDGAFPNSTLLLDAAGNLYGTTFQKGSGNGGVVFELSPRSSGWSETVLYAFSASTGDGTDPNFIVRDAAGNIYGTTALGGPSNSGTVFKLSLGSSGWVETVLYTFAGGTDGFSPTGIVLDPSGNIYGTILSGGNLSDCAKLGCGQVFKLTFAFGTWRKTVVYNFAGGGSDGSTPQGLVMDAAGRLYGATFGGGSTTCGGLSGCGTVFRLIKGASGWRESLIYKFTGTNGKNPEANLLLDSAGNLYGTATEGGLKNSNCDASGCGLVFKLAPTSGGWWIPTTLYEFGSTDGAFPQSTPLLDAAGNLYGTTVSGGASNDGVVFEIQP